MVAATISTGTVTAVSELVTDKSERVQPAASAAVVAPHSQPSAVVRRSRPVPGGAGLRPHAEPPVDDHEQPVLPGVVGSTPSPSSSVAAEVVVLDRARDALQSGDAQRALRALEEHRRRFKGGALAPEARLLRIELLVEQGELGAAAARAFLVDRPTSPHIPRVRTLLRRAEQPAASSAGQRAASPHSSAGSPPAAPADRSPSPPSAPAPQPGAVPGEPSAAPRSGATNVARFADAGED